MQVIRLASDVAHVTDPVMHDFLAKRVANMVMDWAPDRWPDFGQVLMLQSGDDPAIVETAGCLRLTGSPCGAARFGDPGFIPVWDWVDDHGSFYEVAMVTSDAGNFDVVLIPKDIGTSATLLRLCEQLSIRQAAVISPAQATGPLAA
jgi:hypothetical protein